MLARADPDPDHRGLWQWALRTPAGYMVGGPHLPAEPLTRAHTADIGRARQALSRQLRADRAVLADLLAHGEPAGAMARAVAVLEELQAALDAQLES
ncbi:hypothetical protein ABZ234_31895 [Nocardiopsis sp. NPDC006198]|uniref:hypothetical protein n=1 Tax=Nocardiopsis sp. NPDC006198 TaxID=3154472 RepID=UPI0033B97E76